MDFHPLEAINVADITEALLARVVGKGKTRGVANDQDVVKVQESGLLYLYVRVDDFGRIHSVIIAKPVCSFCVGPLITGVGNRLARRTPQRLPDLSESGSESGIAKVRIAKFVFE